MYKNHQIFAKKKKKILMLRLKQEIKVSPDFNRYMQHDQQSLTLNLNSLYFNELAVRCMGPAVRWFLSLFKKGNL